MGILVELMCQAFIETESQGGFGGLHDSIGGFAEEPGLFDTTIAGDGRQWIGILFQRSTTGHEKNDYPKEMLVNISDLGITGGDVEINISKTTSKFLSILFTSKF